MTDEKHTAGCPLNSRKLEESEEYEECRACGHPYPVLRARDHCTPEERAVIEAALGWHNAWQPWSSRIPEAAEKVLFSAVNALLAARKER